MFSSKFTSILSNLSVYETKLFLNQYLASFFEKLIYMLVAFLLGSLRSIFVQYLPKAEVLLSGCCPSLFNFELLATLLKQDGIVRYGGVGWGEGLSNSSFLAFNNTELTLNGNMFTTSQTTSLSLGL